MDEVGKEEMRSSLLKARLAEVDAEVRDQEKFHIYMMNKMEMRNELSDYFFPLIREHEREKVNRGEDNEENEVEEKEAPDFFSKGKRLFLKVVP